MARIITRKTAQMVKMRVKKLSWAEVSYAQNRANDQNTRKEVEPWQGILRVKQRKRSKCA